MSLYKRGITWWFECVAPSGERVRESTGAGDKALAQEYFDHRKVELWRQFRLGEKPRRSWNEAVVRWLKEQSHKATIETDKIHLRWLDRFLGGKSLDAITREVIDKITDAKDRITSIESRGKGMSEGWGLLVGGVAFIVSILSIVGSIIVLLNK